MMMMMMMTSFRSQRNGPLDAVGWVEKWTAPPSTFVVEHDYSRQSLPVSGVVKLCIG